MFVMINKSEIYPNNWFEIEFKNADRISGLKVWHFNSDLRQKFQFEFLINRHKYAAGYPKWELRHYTKLYGTLHN